MPLVRKQTCELNHLSKARAARGRPVTSGEENSRQHRERERFIESANTLGRENVRAIESADLHRHKALDEWPTGGGDEGFGALPFPY